MTDVKTHLVVLWALYTEETFEAPDPVSSQLPQQIVVGTSNLTCLKIIHSPIQERNAIRDTEIPHNQALLACTILKTLLHVITSAIAGEYCRDRKHVLKRTSDATHVHGILTSKHRV